MRSAIYRGTVIHQRERPRRHRLRYSVFSVLIDLDELDALDRYFPLLGINRPGVFSFHERDHGDGETKLRDWVGDLVRTSGIDWDGNRVELLCYPRVFGYVFNPLSVWFCYQRTGSLAAILYEVHNTHRESHTYVLPVPPHLRIVRHETRKRFFVSPFMPPDCIYRFSIAPPESRVGISILEDDAEGLLLAASFAGRRQELSRRALVDALWRYPLMTFKVFAGIHWEALKLLWKGLPVFHHRAASTRRAISFPARDRVHEPAE